MYEYKEFRIQAATVVNFFASFTRSMKSTDHWTILKSSPKLALLKFLQKMLETSCYLINKFDRGLIISVSATAAIPKEAKPEPKSVEGRTSSDEAKLGTLIETLLPETVASNPIDSCTVKTDSSLVKSAVNIDSSVAVKNEIMLDPLAKQPTVKQSLSSESNSGLAAVTAKSDSDNKSSVLATLTQSCSLKSATDFKSDSKSAVVPAKVSKRSDSSSDDCFIISTVNLDRVKKDQQQHGRMNGASVSSSNNSSVSSSPVKTSSSSRGDHRSSSGSHHTSSSRSSHHGSGSSRYRPNASSRNDLQN